MPRPDARLAAPTGFLASALSDIPLRYSNNESMLIVSGDLASDYQAAAANVEAHKLSFYHIHTAEKLTITYREHGELVPGALTEVSRYLRDFRTEQVHDIDVELLDTLHSLYSTFDNRGNLAGQ